MKNLIITNEEGYYELYVEGDTDDAKGDVKGYCNKRISEHLASAIKDTDVPLNEGLWEVIFSDWSSKNIYQGKIGFKI